MKKGKVILIICSFCISLASMEFVNKSISPETKVNKNTLSINSNKIIKFNDLGISNFTCTGMTYDKDSDSIWVGDYGALSVNDKPSPRVIEFDKNMTTIKKELSLESITDDKINLQGISYDSISNSLWLATGDNVYNINKSGNLISSFSMGKYAKYKSNGITVDGNKLWILCYSRYLLKMDKFGNVEAEFQVNYENQDHICLLENGNIFVTVGADYNGDNNFVFEIDTTTGNSKVVYRTIDSYSVEGIVVIDKKMYIANDGKYHNAKINDSYIAIYDIE